MMEEGPEYNPVQELFNAMTDAQKRKAAEVADCAATVYAHTIKNGCKAGTVASYTLPDVVEGRLIRVSVSLVSEPKDDPTKTRQRKRCEKRLKAKGRL